MYMQAKSIKLFIFQIHMQQTIQLYSYDSRVARMHWDIEKAPSDKLSFLLYRYIYINKYIFEWIYVIRELSVADHYCVWTSSIKTRCIQAQYCCCIDAVCGCENASTERDKSSANIIFMFLHWGFQFGFILFSSFNL